MKMIQLSVFIENKPGELFKMINCISGNGINIRAINIAESDDYGIVRLVTDEYKKTADILLKNKFVFQETTVIAKDVDDRPGGLLKILTEFKEKNIGFKYMYSCFGRKEGTATMVFKMDRPEYDDIAES